MSNPRIEIKQSDGEQGIFTEIYVDGHKLKGVRRFELKQEVGNSIPVLTVDLNAINFSTDVRAVLMQEGYGEIEISVKEPSENDS